MSVVVEDFAPGQRVTEFIDVAGPLYANDRAYVAPLRMELKDRLTPGKNPFWLHGEGRLFIAKRHGRAVGRASATIDREHLKLHKDGAGFFGFFETIDDQEVADALLDACRAWLRAKGMTKMRGPLSLCINEESGVLVDGFDTPPALSMPHHREYQHRLIEGAGLEKVKDLLAWKYVTEEPPKRAKRAWDTINALPEVKFRSVDPSKMRAELDLILEIFNDAWADNWGFVPTTEAEVAQAAKDMRLIIDPRLAFFAEVDGEVAAMVICLPNLPSMIADLDGRLFPFGWAKMLWRLKVEKPKSARLMMLGIKRKFRGVKRYGALSTAMYAELAYRGMRHGYEWAELSWTLEDNRAINLGIKAMRGKVYKTYRIYEETL